MFGPHYPPKEVRRNVKIRFVGVWDTVAAYGMPVDEMTRGIHQYIWPIELPNNHLSASVKRACQALALDEERTTFHPQLWDETTGMQRQHRAPDADARRFIKDERISQVWFAGVHTNVGGGYPDDALAYIPFVWMITEAKRCGLKFKSDYANQPPDPDLDDRRSRHVQERDLEAGQGRRLYDPRKGLGGYYRYGPRKLVPFLYPETRKLEDDEVDVGSAKIHESVFRRIANHAHAYAPVGLPPYYRRRQGRRRDRDAGQVQDCDSTEPFETSTLRRGARLAQEHVWNEIWKRRILYFATVGATLWLVVFPLVSGAQRYDEYTSPIRWVSDLVRFVGGFLPGFASTWINGYARAPVWFLVAGWPGFRFAVCVLANGRPHRKSDGFDLAKDAGGAVRPARQLIYRSPQQPALHRLPRTI